MGLNLVFLGLPGSGKGTQALEIAKKFELNLISVGDLLRDECDKKSDLGLKIKKRIDEGELVTLDIIEELLRQNIDSKDGFIFDGIPRNIEQAVLLDKLMQERDARIDLVIEFQISENSIIDRIKHRYICNQCGAILCLNNATDKYCLECGVDDIFKRKDDCSTKAVNNRINVYNEEFHDIKNFYIAKSVLYSIDADRNLEEVTCSIMDLISKSQA
ncbi:MAG: nucleoside monophosphate kinase [Alphaproteobacteria bacterium]|nr:MAG: nucleoside monophosphate kinase [Alphaproteobacteria bacterium]